MNTQGDGGRADATLSSVLLWSPDPKRRQIPNDTVRLVNTRTG